MFWNLSELSIRNMSMLTRVEWIILINPDKICTFATNVYLC